MQRDYGAGRARASGGDGGVAIAIDLEPDSPEAEQAADLLRQRGIRVAIHHLP